MKRQIFRLGDGRELALRQARPENARAIMDYVEEVCGESNYLTFGPGEFGYTEEQETELLQGYLQADNQLYMVAEIGDEIVGSLSFAGGRRSRMRHCGEFGMSVRRSEWRKGIGAILLDAFIQWARDGGIIKKISLRVRTDNPGAVELYHRRGFVLEGTHPREIFIEGIFYDLCSMGLLL